MTCWRRLGTGKCQVCGRRLGTPFSILWDWQIRSTGPRRLKPAVRRRLFLGEKAGPNPTDCGKNGSKRHIISDCKGVPLVVIQIGVNEHDSRQAIPLVHSIPVIKRTGGVRWSRPEEMYAERTYDAKAEYDDR